MVDANTYRVSCESCGYEGDIQPIEANVMDIITLPIWIGCLASLALTVLNKEAICGVIGCFMAAFAVAEVIAWVIAWGY